MAGKEDCAVCTNAYWIGSTLRCRKNRRVPSDGEVCSSASLVPAVVRLPATATKPKVGRSKRKQRRDPLSRGEDYTTIGIQVTPDEAHLFRLAAGYEQRSVAAFIRNAVFHWAESNGYVKRKFVAGRKIDKPNISTVILLRDESEGAK